MASISASSLAADVLLIFLPTPDDGRVWPDPAWIAATEARYPGLRVRWLRREDPETGLPREIDQLPADVWDGVTLLCSSWPPSAHLIPGVRFVQVPSAGLDRWIRHEAYLNPAVAVCTGNGTHATQIGEWVVGTWLMWRHQFLLCAEYMKTGIGFEKRGGLQALESGGARVGILGYGAIGREVARLLKAFHMEVYAYTRTERATAATRRDESFCLPGTGDAAGELPTRWFHGSTTADINNFLAQDLDLLVIATPLTAATTGLLGAEQFALLESRSRERGRPKNQYTYIVNVARGKVIDTDALIAALTKGQIAGAALDVTDPEPLPKDHALWQAPNVFITPHVSWQSQERWQRALGMLEKNLERLNSGEPLINKVNKDHHY